MQILIIIGCVLLAFINAKVAYEARQEAMTSWPFTFFAYTFMALFVLFLFII